MIIDEAEFLSQPIYNPGLGSGCHGKDKNGQSVPARDGALTPRNKVVFLGYRAFETASAQWN